MIFNTDKCKVMHFGYRNTTAGYSLGNVNIQSGKEEKDLRIIINQTLKSSQQCVAAANTANRTLGMINRTFVNKHSNIMLRLCKGPGSSVWDQCNIPVSWGNQGEVPVSGLSGEIGSTCVVDGPNT